MKKCINWVLKHKIISFIFLVIIVPIIINESYKMGAGYLTKWEAADALSYYGSILSFAGSVVLGFVAIVQNEKAQKVNDQLQKLQQAEYVSMVSVKRVMIDKISNKTPNFMNEQMPQIEVIDMKKKEFDSQESYYVDVEFKNDSKYPIVQMQVHPSKRDNGDGIFCGMENWIDQAVYIPTDQSACFRFIIPCEFMDSLAKHAIQISINFINVFDYTTPANLYIFDLRKEGICTEYKYRLLKFVDVRPKD